MQRSVQTRFDASRFCRTEETYERFVSAGGKVYDLSGFGDDEATMRAKIKRAKFDGDRVHQLA